MYFLNHLLTIKRFVNFPSNISHISLYNFPRYSISFSFFFLTCGSGSDVCGNYILYCNIPTPLGTSCKPDSVDMCGTVPSYRRSTGLSECFCNYYKSRIWFMPCNKLQQRMRTIRDYLRPQNTYKVCGPWSPVRFCSGLGSGIWDLGFGTQSFTSDLLPT